MLFTPKFAKAQSHKQGISPKLKNLYRHALSVFRSQIGCFMSKRAAHFFQKPFHYHDHWITPLAALLFCMMNFGSLQSARAEEIREPEQIIGDLGGMPISVSSSIVGEHGVKYADSWMVLRQKPLPARTYQSRLIALNFNMRFTDRALLTKKETELLNSSTNVTETPLLEVGIYADIRYKDGALKHLHYLFNENSKNKELFFSLDDLKQKIYGLSASQLLVKLSRTGEQGPTYITPKRAFFAGDEKTKLKTSIYCANPKNETTQCVQGWGMDEQEVQIFVQVRIEPAYWSTGGPFRRL
jgi:hypothetical protein